MRRLVAFFERPVPNQQPRRFWLWPEHLPVLELWLAVRGKWQVGMAGPVALDSAAVEAEMRVRGRWANARRRRRLWDGIRIMERATLAWWAEQRERDAPDA